MAPVIPDFWWFGAERANVDRMRLFHLGGGL